MADFNSNFNDIQKQIAVADLTDEQIQELVATLQTRRSARPELTKEERVFFQCCRERRSYANNKVGADLGIDTALIDEMLNITLSSAPVKDNTLEVMENTVSGIGKGTFQTAVELSDEDANTLSAIINGSTWKEELTDCERDCIINLKGHWSHYNSESGILNKYNVKDMSVYSSKVQEVSGKSLVLSEEDRITVNAMLEKYITLGVESN